MITTPRRRAGARLRPRPAAPVAQAPAPHSLAMTAGAVVTSLTAIGALVFTGLSLNATREQVAASQRQNDVAQQGQFTDRFTKAVDQLDQSGPDHLQARLGGVYALERLAKDSPRDQPTVVQVLAAFLRTTSPDPEEDALEADIQAALTTLAGRDTAHDGGVRVDLTSADLNTARLPRAALSHAVLHRANLSRAHLTGADMTGADLTETNLYEADLRGARLGGASLAGSNLTGATLAGADLTGASLEGADLRGADLGRALHDGTTITTGAITDSRTVGKWW